MISITYGNTQLYYKDVGFGVQVNVMIDCFYFIENTYKTFGIKCLLIEMGLNVARLRGDKRR